MLSLIVVGTLIVIFGVACYTTLFTESRKLTREDFLDKLTDVTDAQKHKLSDDVDTCQLYFQFDKRQFVYEDIEAVGFRQNIHQAVLKTQTKSDLDLVLTKKDKSASLGRMQLMSHLDEKSLGEITSVHLPEKLKDCKVLAKDITKTNALLRNKEFVSIVSKYKNYDRYGEPNFPIAIREGVVILTFAPTEKMKPNIVQIKHQVSLFEKYVEDVNKLAKILDRMEI